MTLSPRLLRWIVAGLAMVVLLTAWVFPSTPPSAVSVRFVYSKDAKDLLEPLIGAFNAEHEGEINVAGEEGPSGQTEHDMAHPEGADQPVKPDLWMPASEAWGRLLNTDTEATWYPEGSPSFFWSPMAVVTWGSDDTLSATAGWDEIFPLVTAEQTSTFGGRWFRWAHTKPTTSTSGLFETVAEFSHAAGATLSDPGQVDAATEGVQLIERNLVHYGDVGKDFCDLIGVFGSDFMTATYMQETVMKTCAASPPYHPELRAIYPDAKAFVADYPCAVLDAPWSSAERQEAAAEVCSWLGERLAEDAALAANHFFRPGTAPSSGTSFPAEAAPDAAPPVEMIEALPIPSGATLAAVRDRWLDVRKPANVVVLHDVSDEMSNTVFLPSVRFTQALVRELDDGDRVRVYKVAKTALPVPITDGEVSGGQLQAGSGPIYLRDAIADVLSRKNLMNDGSINVIVIVSAGVDGGSEISSAQLDEKVVELRTGEKFPVQIITVSFGEPWSESLKAISDKAESRSFNASDPTTTPDEIAQLIAKAL